MIIFKTIADFFKKLFTSRKRFVHGWQKDIEDTRDILFSVQPPDNSVPPSVDLRSGCPPVYDQGRIGSCTANAIGAAIEFDQIKENKAWDFTPSRLFIYYNERVIENSTGQDAGAQIRDGIKAVNAQGVCKETLWPYIVQKFTVPPTPNCYQEAILHKALSYARLDNGNLNALKSCLASGFPFVFGFQVFESFEGPKVASTGILEMPHPGERCMGGHAVMCVGYDDARKAFLVRNSWGAGWGEKGYFWMPYEYMTTASLASDFWVIQSVDSNEG